MKQPQNSSVWKIITELYNTLNAICCSDMLAIVSISVYSLSPSMAVKRKCSDGLHNRKYLNVMYLSICLPF